MTPQQRWYWAINYFNNKISLLYSLCSCKTCSISLCFRQFGVCQVNTAQSSKLAQLTFKQMSKIWYKNIPAFLIYRDFRVRVFFTFTLGSSNSTCFKRLASIVAANSHHVDHCQWVVSSTVDVLRWLTTYTVHVYVVYKEWTSNVSLYFEPPCSRHFLQHC